MYKNQYQPLVQDFPPDSAPGTSAEAPAFSEAATFTHSRLDNDILCNDDEGLDDVQVTQPTFTPMDYRDGGLHVGQNAEIGIYQSHYAMKRTEENIKCVVSSAIFIAIILLTIILAFVKNPQMG